LSCVSPSWAKGMNVSPR